MIASNAGSGSRDRGSSDGLVLVVALSVFLWIYVSTAAVMEDLGSDTTTYFELARSIWLQHRYWFNFEPHTVYPPGYPFLLAGMMMVAGDSFGTLVKLCAPIYFLGLFCLYWLVQLQRGRKTAIVVVLLGTVSSFGYVLATVGFLSEIPYFTVSVAALLFVELAGRTSAPWRRHACHVLVALSASYLLLLRGIGVTFVAGLILWVALPCPWLGRPHRVWSLNRARPWLAVILLPIAVQFTWSSWVKRHTPVDRPLDYMQSYSRQILKSDPHQVDSPNITAAQVPARILTMAGIRTTNALGLVFNLDSVSLSAFNPICLAFLFVVAMGFLTALFREGRLLDYYVLVYVGLLLVYPFNEGQRYLFPIQPFIVMYGIDGLEFLRNLGRRFGERHGGITGVVFGSNRVFALARALLVFVILANGASGIAAQARTNHHPDPATFSQATTIRVAGWVSRNTRDDDVIMDDQFAILHRLTRRRTVRFPLSSDPDFIAERIVAEKVGFVVVAKEKRYEYYNPSTMKRFEAVKSRHPGMFVPVEEFDKGTVYRVRQLVTETLRTAP